MFKSKKAASCAKIVLLSAQLFWHELSEPEATPAVWGSAREPGAVVQNSSSRLVARDY